MVRRRELPLVAGLAGLGLIGAGLVTSRLQVLPPVGTDLLVGLGAALSVANARLLAWCPLRAPIKVGADFSYSLYLIHVPVTVFAGALIERFGWPAVLAQPGLPAFAVFAGLVAAAMVTAFIFAQATERHTDSVRKALFGRRRAVVTAFPSAAG